MTEEKKQGHWLWPDVSTIEGAEAAAGEGTKAALAIVLLAVVPSLYVMYKVPEYSFPIRAMIEAAVFCVIAVGNYHALRTTAVLGLVIFVVEKAYLFATVGPSGVRGVLLFLFITYFLFHGVRGTFGYHRLLKAQSGLNAVGRAG